jgi:hypothetical protein
MIYNTRNHWVSELCPSSVKEVQKLNDSDLIHRSAFLNHGTSWRSVVKFEPPITLPPGYPFHRKLGGHGSRALQLSLFLFNYLNYLPFASFLLFILPTFILRSFLSMLLIFSFLF